MQLVNYIIAVTSLPVILFAFSANLYAGLGMYDYPEIQCKSQAVKCRYTDIDTSRTVCWKYLDNPSYIVVGGSGDVHSGYYRFCPKNDVPFSAQIKHSWDSFVDVLIDNSVRIAFALLLLAIVLAIIKKKLKDNYHPIK